MAGLPPLRLGPRAVTLTRRADGAMLLRAPHALNPYPDKITERLAHYATSAPDRVFMAEREKDGSGWRRITYAEAHAAARALGQALIDRGLSAERPLVILSGNDIEHAMLKLAAQYVGVPYASLSPAYSLVSSDFGKLKYILDLLTPGLVFASDGAAFARAIDAVVPPGLEVTTNTDWAAAKAKPFRLLRETVPKADVDRAYAAVGPDTIAKFLFTSGSTGMPKGVINTQRMICSNLQMIADTYPFLADDPPVLLDWLPWNHTFGGNHNIGITLYHGGTLHIDDGKPLPGFMDRTVRNLREIAPTVYFNVPKGFEAILNELRRDRALRDFFFSRLRMLFYSGAGMPRHVWDGLLEISREATGRAIYIGTGLGATETAPSSLFTHWHAERPGIVGLPVPGVELKLVPLGAKLEARVRGPNVMPGYWRQPELTAKAFDEEGFYCFGDALTFVDPDDPLQGLEFDGRIAEDFKLTTGTWVSVGPLRVRIIAAGAPLVRDAVIAGHDRDFVAALLFPDMEGCAALAGLPAGSGTQAVLDHPAVRTRFQKLVDDLAAQATGSANRVERLVLLAEPPSIDANEVTDKGSINQRAVLQRRAAIVEQLYAETPPNAVFQAQQRKNPNAA